MAAAVLLTGISLAGCSGDDQPPPASPTLSPAASPTPTERPSAPEPSPTASVGLQALPDDASLNGAVAIDPATGSVVPVWLGTDRIWGYPTLTPGGDAVWLSWDGSEESVRFDLDGNEVDRVPGVRAKESPDGTVVLYYSSPAEEQHLIAQYPDRTVDLGEGGEGVVGADGRIAFLGPYGDDGQSLFMYDPERDDTWVVAEGITRAKGGGIPDVVAERPLPLRPLEPHDRPRGELLDPGRHRDARGADRHDGVVLAVRPERRRLDGRNRRWRHRLSRRRHQ